MNTRGSSEHSLVKMHLLSSSVDDPPTSFDFCPGVNTEASLGSVAGRTISCGFSDGDI